MIAAKDIRREFASGEGTVVAVDDVTFTLEDGVFAAVVGPSGSGKSTLLSVLGTLDKPTSGTLEIDGEDVTALPEGELTAYRRSRIGFVFQSYNLIPNLSAAANVELPMEFAGVPASERHERAAKLLERVGLSAEKHGRKPGRLSGGEQQRVAIARALANKPCLILADEPTGNLDTETGARIIALLRELARAEKTTILAVTHDLEMAAQADKTFRLVDGRLVDLDDFDSAVGRTGAAYQDWVRQRDNVHMRAFLGALGSLIASAPEGRKLSANKIRSRYPEAKAEPGFVELLRPLESEDLFTDEG